MVFLRRGITDMSLRLKAGQLEVELLTAAIAPEVPLDGWAISQSKPDADVAEAAGLVSSGLSLIAFADGRKPTESWARYFAHFVVECSKCRSAIHVPIRLPCEDRAVNIGTRCTGCGETNNIVVFHMDLEPAVTRFVFLSPGIGKWCRTARLSRITETAKIPDNINQTLALLDSSKNTD